MANLPKMNDDKTLATGESEAEAARPVRFEPQERAGPDDGKGDPANEPPDAGDLADAKRETDNEDKAAPGAIAPENLTTESDDGAG